MGEGLGRTSCQMQEQPRGQTSSVGRAGVAARWHPPERTRRRLPVHSAGHRREPALPGRRPPVTITRGAAAVRSNGQPSRIPDSDRRYQAYASGASPPGPGQIPSSAASVSAESRISSARRLAGELLDRARADDRRRHDRVREQPRERHVRRLLAELPAERLVRLELRAVPLDALAAGARRRGGPRPLAGARRRAARRRAGSTG